MAAVTILVTKLLHKTTKGGWLQPPLESMTMPCLFALGGPDGGKHHQHAPDEKGNCQSGGNPVEPLCIFHALKLVRQY